MAIAASESPAANDGLCFFAMNDSAAFGAAVAQALGVPASLHEEREFEDGEHKCRPLVNVRGRDVFVLQSLYGGPVHSGNDKLCRLLFFIGALRDAGAARVSALVPYLAYARKDRKTKPRDPVITRYVAAMFEAAGADAVVTLDVHNLAAFQNAFRCRTEHLEANPLFVRYFAAQLQGRAVVVVAPDAGGTKRAEHFRQSLGKALGTPVAAAFAEKHRSEGVVSGDMLVGEVEGRDAVIIDDLISTGGTLARTAASCIERGAARVFAAASHGLFIGEAGALLGRSAFERIVVTDSVPAFRLADPAAQAKLVVLPSAPLFGEAIRRAHTGGSISQLLET